MCNTLGANKLSTKKQMNVQPAKIAANKKHTYIHGTQVFTYLYASVIAATHK